MPKNRLTLGQIAPDFTLRGAAHSSLSLAALEGRPVVIAFVDRFAPDREGPGELSTLRAELRGIGAILVVLSDTGAWSFRPDDDLERFAARSDELAADVAEAARRYGVPRPARDGRTSPSIFVIDGDRKVRFVFAHARAGVSDPVVPSLAWALGAAGRALTAPPPASLLVSRREWVMTSLVAAFTLAFVDGCASPSPGAPPPLVVPSAPSASTAGLSGDIDVRLLVNGVARVVRIDPRVSLLDALRERLGLTGTKKGCDHGQCGACTVLVDERRVNACLTLAVMLEGASVTTIEGLAQGGELHPVQAAFVAEDGFQCGYCTPGQIMSAVGLLQEGHATSDAEVREGMSGNLCRCGAYPNIVAAVQLARSRGTHGKAV